MSLESKEEERVNDIKKSSDDNSLNSELLQVGNDTMDSEDLTEVHEDADKIKRGEVFITQCYKATGLKTFLFYLLQKLL